MFRKTVMAFGALGLAAVAWGAPTPPRFVIVKRIAGPDGGWDYASFDAARHRVYVANGNSVLTVDADTGRVNSTFAEGDEIAAVVPIPGGKTILTTNGGDDTARFIDAADGKLIKSIGVPKGPDGAFYDARLGQVFVVSKDAGVITMIDPAKMTKTASIQVDGSLEFAAMGGDGRIYVNVEDQNRIAVVDVATRKVVGSYALPGCEEPTGLAYVEGSRLVSACSNGIIDIVSAVTGRVLSSIKAGGFPDAVIYDRRQHLALVPSAGNAKLSVISLCGPQRNSMTGQVETELGTRTGTIDPRNGQIYLPTGDYILPPPPGERPKVKPGTFKVLVLSPNPAFAKRYSRAGHCS